MSDYPTFCYQFVWLTSSLRSRTVANRGEIPIRIFRTAHELSLSTVAVFSYEDRLSMHRQKADEAYVIGKRGQYTPVGAYLAGDEIIKIALQHGVNMIHPGYGFLSENAQFARSVEKAGLIVSTVPPPISHSCHPANAFLIVSREVTYTFLSSWVLAQTLSTLSVTRFRPEQSP